MIVVVQTTSNIIEGKFDSAFLLLIILKRAQRVSLIKEKLNHNKKLTTESVDWNQYKEK